MQKSALFFIHLLTVVLWHGAVRPSICKLSEKKSVNQLIKKIWPKYGYVLIFNLQLGSFFFQSCKILFDLVKFMTAPDQMSGNV